MPFKLYVDSRFRVQTGGSSSDTEFAIELPHPLQVKGKAFIDTCLVPNTFYTIRAGENDRVHLSETVSNTVHYRIAQIAEGQYNAITLKNALLAAIQTGRQHALEYVVEYDIPTSKLVVYNLDPGASFGIYPTGWLRANAALWNGVAGAGLQIDPRDLQDAGAVLGSGTGTSILFGGPGNPSLVVTMPQACNVQPYGQLFLRSSLGNGYDAISCDGSSDVVRRIVVGGTPLNSTVVDQHGLPHDSITVGNRELSSLAFRLTDAEGRTVDTHGHHVSFSIIFLADDE